MLRPLQPLDLLRAGLTGGVPGPDRAWPLTRVGAPGAPGRAVQALRALTASYGPGVSWVWQEGPALRAVVTASPRSGPLSWEVTHLLVDRPVAHAAELAARVSQEALAHGAQRVFLRLLRNDPMAELAPMAGFFPHLRETLYACHSPTGAEGRLPPGAILRRRREADLHDIYRLYQATAPVEVRACGGMTFQQWSHSLERLPGRPRELVYERDGVLRGWLRLSRRSGRGYVELLLHPEEVGHLALLVGAAEEALAGVSVILCLVPHYRGDLEHLLPRRGYGAVEEYVTLVKSMMVRKGAEERRAAVTQPSV